MFPIYNKILQLYSPLEENKNYNNKYVFCNKSIL